MPAKTPLAGDKIDATAAYAAPFRPYYGGVVTRTRNVSEYMLVLALCLVFLVPSLSPTHYLYQTPATAGTSDSLLTADYTRAV